MTTIERPARPSVNQTWLDVVSAVDYLGASHRYGFTVWDAIEEATRWWNAAHFTGDPLAALEASQLPWSDPDPLRSSLEHLVEHLEPADSPEATSTQDALHEALTHWTQRMATEYNNGHPWTHPRDHKGFPTPLTLPFERDEDR
jgi:hypothetical protein